MSVTFNQNKQVATCHLKEQSIIGAQMISIVQPNLNSYKTMGKSLLDHTFYIILLSYLFQFNDIYALQHKDSLNNIRIATPL